MTAGIYESLHTFGALAFVVCVALACKRGGESGGSAGTTKTGPSDEARATALCQKLVAAGVAKNCGSPDRTSGIGVDVNFEVVGGSPQDRGTASCDSDAEHFKVDGVVSDGGCQANDNVPSPSPFFCPPADDYWNQHATSTATQLSVSWFTESKPGVPNGREENTWEKCRGLRGPKKGSTMWTTSNTVAACAKLHPKEYAAYHALYDAAKAAVNVP